MRQRNLQRQAIAYGRALFADLKTRPGGTQVNERRLCFLDRFSMRCKNGQNDIYARDNAPLRLIASLCTLVLSKTTQTMNPKRDLDSPEPVKNRVKDTFIGEIQHVKPNRETEAGRTVRRLDWRKRIEAAQQNTANF